MLRFMADRYVFADEAGDFGFNRKQRASRYFIVTTVALSDCRVGDALLQLRRDLTWRNRNLARPFHAAKDHPDVRREVFRLIMRYPFRVDATALEKQKTEPKYQSDTEMYKLVSPLEGDHTAHRDLPGPPLCLRSKHGDEEDSRAL